MRVIRPQRRRDAEDQSSCLRVSASPRAILPQADSHSGRRHGRQPRSVSMCMRLSRPQRCRDAEDQSPCLRVSASPRAILPLADSHSGRCHGRQPRSVSRCMRLIRPQGRRDAEDQSPCLCVSASPRAILPQADSHSGRCHGRQPRSVSVCMRLIRPQRRRDAEDQSPCLCVSASQRAIPSPSRFPQRPMPWAATDPPVLRIPEGCQPGCAPGAGIPAGMRGFSVAWVSGGVVASLLDHRLQAAKPPPSWQGDAEVTSDAATRARMQGTSRVKGASGRQACGAGRP